MDAPVRDFMSIAEAAGRIERREISPVELVEATLARIEALNPHLDAFVTLTAERSVEQARAAETEMQAGRYRGPLHGIPFGLKDIINTFGILTSGHSKFGIDTIPDEDATVVAKLYEAGAVLMGKLSTHEYAHGGPSFDLPWPPARNPWNTDHFTGGSSSGPASAVAAGLVLGALGSDTGGSIRNPAGLCGIAGLKTTYGLVSRHGIYANSYTFDTCGPMAWTVEDCALLLQAIAGPDAKDPASAGREPEDYRAALTGDIRGLRIGVVRHFWEDDLPAGDEVKAALDAAVDVLTGLGARIEDVRMRPLQDYYDVKIVIAEVELFNVHGHNLRTRAQDFGEDFLGRCLPACLMTANDYMDAQRERRLQMADAGPLFERFDVLVTAGYYGPAPRIDRVRTRNIWERPSIGVPFNVIGGPALSLCIGFSESGLPLAMQVAGRPFDEATVLRVGDAYERATPWRERRPQVGPPTVHGPGPREEAPSVDAAARRQAEEAAHLSGLRLDDSQLLQIAAAAPYVNGMTGRLRRDRRWQEEPANIFVFPDRH